MYRLGGLGTSSPSGGGAWERAGDPHVTGAGCQSTGRCELGRKEAGPHGRAGSPQSLERITLRKGPWSVCPAPGGQHPPLYPRDGHGDLGVKWLIVIPLKHRLMLFAWICTSTLLQCRLAGLCVVEKMLWDSNILDHPADIFLIFSTLVCLLAQHLQVTGNQFCLSLENSGLATTTIGRTSASTQHLPITAGTRHWPCTWQM